MEADAGQATGGVHQCSFNKCQPEARHQRCVGVVTETFECGALEGQPLGEDRVPVGAQQALHRDAQRFFERAHIISRCALRAFVEPARHHEICGEAIGLAAIGSDHTQMQQHALQFCDGHRPKTKGQPRRKSASGGGGSKNAKVHGPQSLWHGAAAGVCL